MYKVFLEISQNSQENTYARVSFFIRLQPWPARVNQKMIKSSRNDYVM